MFFVIALVFGLALFILNERKSDSKEKIQSLVDHSGLNLDDISHVVQNTNHQVDTLYLLGFMGILAIGGIMLGSCVFFAYLAKDT